MVAPSSFHFLRMPPFQIPVLAVFRLQLRDADACIRVVLMPVGGVEEQAGFDMLNIATGLEEIRVLYRSNRKEASRILVGEFGISSSQ